MAMSAVKNWFGRPGKPVAPPPPRAVADIPPTASRDEAPAAPAKPAWTPERLVITDTLWGEGYHSPGGEIEVLRLTKPMGLSAASTLLLLGAGAGGASCSLATRLGVWVNGFETDPQLAADAVERIARKNLSKRAQIETWNPETAVFREKFHHHGLVLEALNGARPEPALAAIAATLKPNAQLSLVELVADTPLDPHDPAVATWARLEHRDPAALPAETAITRILGRLGFDVRVTEDMSQRHMHQALTGWRAAVRGMGHVAPSRREALSYVNEAELWLFRLRLLQLGRLRLIRWHAIKGS